MRNSLNNFRLLHGGLPAEFGDFVAKIAFSGEYSMPGVNLSLNLFRGYTVLVDSIDFIK